MKKFLTIFTIISIIIVIMLSTISFAEDINPSEYESIYNPISASEVDTLFQKVLGIIQVIGIGIAVIVLSLIGVQYMTGSIQEKAKAKERLILFVIGAILLFGGTTIMSIAAKWAQSQ